jgi:hypothetical protein
MSEPGRVQFGARSLILKVSDFKDFLEVINLVLVFIDVFPFPKWEKVGTSQNMTL